MNISVRAQLYKIANREKGNVREKKKYVIIAIVQIPQRIIDFFVSFENFAVVFRTYILPRAKIMTRAIAAYMLKNKYSFKVGRTL